MGTLLRVQHHDTIEKAAVAIGELVCEGWRLNKITKEDDGSFVVELAEPGLPPYLEHSTGMHGSEGDT